MVGKPILLGGDPYTVVGILPATFHSDPPADVFIPLQADPNSTNQGHYLLAAGRLKPGATLDSAKANMTVAGEQFRRRQSQVDGQKRERGRNSPARRDGWRCSPGSPDSGGSCRLRSADRLRERRQSVAGARRRTPEGNRHSHRRRRQPRRSDPPVAHRKRPAFRYGRSARLADWSLERAAVAGRQPGQSSSHQR